MRKAKKKAKPRRADKMQAKLLKAQAKARHLAKINENLLVTITNLNNRIAGMVPA